MTTKHQEFSIGDRVTAEFWYERQWTSRTGIVDKIYQYTDQTEPGYQILLDEPMPNGWIFAQSCNVTREQPAMHHDDSRAIVAEIKREANGYDPEPVTHYHVVAFINGCLNDYDSGPMDTAYEAQEVMAQYCADGGMQPWHECVWNDADNVTNGPYTIAIEPCTEPGCLEMDDEPF